MIIIWCFILWMWFCFVFCFRVFLFVCSAFLLFFVWFFCFVLFVCVCVCVCVGGGGGGGYFLFCFNGPIPQTLQCIRQISNNVPPCNWNVHTSAHLRYKVVYCVIWDRGIAGFVHRVYYWYQNDSRLTYTISCCKYNARACITCI